MTPAHGLAGQDRNVPIEVSCQRSKPERRGQRVGTIHWVLLGGNQNTGKAQINSYSQALPTLSDCQGPIGAMGPQEIKRRAKL